MSLPRRVFLITTAATCAAVTLGARAQSMVDEKDAQAAALGYVGDATRADAAKFPKYAAGQTCGNCAVFQGKAGDKAGNCALFAGKQVAGAGWCSAWAKKA